MKNCIATFAAVFMAVGCTATSLERHTINQAMSVSDMRYQQVLDNFARLQADPSSLPSFATLANGASVLTDTAGIESATTWDRALHGFSKETLTPSFRHNPDPSWTLNPIVAAPHLYALDGAFLWVLRGPPPPGSPIAELLNGRLRPDDYSYHFDVAKDLATLPPTPSWLHVTSKKDVPGNACYKSNCGNIYVSVTPDGMAALSAFTLIVLDIATTDPASLAIGVPTAQVERAIPISHWCENASCIKPDQCTFCQNGFQSRALMPANPPPCMMQSSNCVPSAISIEPVPAPVLAPPGPRRANDWASEVDTDTLKTLITENWFVFQGCDGKISVLQPSNWCDPVDIRVDPIGGNMSPIQHIGPKLMTY